MKLVVPIPITYRERHSSVGMANEAIHLNMNMRYLLPLIAVTLKAVISATPIATARQSPNVDMGNAIFRRQFDCGTRPCANPQGRWVIYRDECVRYGCGLCGTRGFCLLGAATDDRYDPDDPRNPYGGGAGAAGNGEGSDDSSNTCLGDNEHDDAGSCHTITGKTAGAVSQPAAPVSRKQKASCTGSCFTGAYDGSCGTGCGCNWVGTGLFGGLDGSCIALASFGG